MVINILQKKIIQVELGGEKSYMESVQKYNTAIKMWVVNVKLLI